MNDLKIGQVLTLRIIHDNIGNVTKEKHPYLIIDICKKHNYVEVAQLTGAMDKPYLLLKKFATYIKVDSPNETVIDKDSYLRADNKYTIELFDDLVKYRRQSDTLSEIKLSKLIFFYKNYQENVSEVYDNKIVHMSYEDITKINN